MFLKLSGQIEGQLREAYAKKNEAGLLNQSALAERLGVDRSAVNRRLTGKINMTEETIADMVWALDHDIEVRIFDPIENQSNRRPPLNAPVVSTPNFPPSLPMANTGSATSTTATSTPVIPSSMVSAS